MPLPDRVDYVFDSVYQEPGECLTLSPVRFPFLRSIRAQATAKAIFGQARKQLGLIFHALARQKECQIIEGHVMPDHVHMRNARKSSELFRQVKNALKTNFLS